MTKNKMTRMKKLLGRTAALILAAALVLGGAVYAVWHEELSTLASIELVRARNDAHQDGAVYTMQVKGGFYLDEFVAQGGVKSDTELIDFVTNKITKGLLKMTIEDPEIGCSSFTANAKDGDVLFGRNYDFSKTNSCIVFTEANEGRHASVSSVDLQFLGIDVDKDLNGLMDKITCLAAAYAPLDGMNDAGVACGIYMTYQGGEQTVPTDQNTDKPDLTSTTLLRLILDYADDVEEAVEIAQSYDLHDSAKTSYHYMVADASGKSAILEWTAGTDATDNDGAARTLKVIYCDADDAIGTLEAQTDLQVVTNFVLQPGYYDGAAETDKKGFDRYVCLSEALQETKGVVADEEQAMEILSLVGRRSWNNDDSNACTVHSAVYNLTDRTMLWVANENYDDPTAIFRFGF